ncbi:hypothetical protein T492DRAFT_34220 [Pavlovales sp. CCMP2436]|nr:hypothetical protein T492DRAFT_34220 [Pavlovales sp. CCMP2436]
MEAANRATALTMVTVTVATVASPVGRGRSSGGPLHARRRPSARQSSGCPWLGSLAAQRGRGATVRRLWLAGESVLALPMLRRCEREAVACSPELRPPLRLCLWRVEPGRCRLTSTLALPSPRAAQPPPQPHPPSLSKQRSSEEARRSGMRPTAAATGTLRCPPVPCAPVACSTNSSPRRSTRLDSAPLLPGSPYSPATRRPSSALVVLRVSPALEQARSLDCRPPTSRSPGREEGPPGTPASPRVKPGAGALLVLLLVVVVVSFFFTLPALWHIRHAPPLPSRTPIAALCRRHVRVSLEELAAALERALAEQRSGWRPSARAIGSRTPGSRASSARSGCSSAHIPAAGPSAGSSVAVAAPATEPDRELFLGVSLDFLKRFVSEHGLTDDTLTSQVGRLVAVETAASSMSLAAQEYEQCRLADTSLTARGVGIATVFVSHAQSMSFTRLVDALGEYSDPRGSLDGGVGADEMVSREMPAASQQAAFPQVSDRLDARPAGSPREGEQPKRDSAGAATPRSTPSKHESPATPRRGRRLSARELASYIADAVVSATTPSGRVRRGGGKEDATVYFWLDVFSIPQSRIISTIQYIPKLLTSIGAVTLVVDPWRQPRCLTRVWCLLELLHAFQV